MKSSPSAARSPPKTAVSLVDLRRHQATITGESNDATHSERAASAPETSIKVKDFTNVTAHDGITITDVAL